MPAVVSLYDHTIDRFVRGFNSTSDTYRVALYSTLTPDLSVTTLAAITGTEVAQADGYITKGAQVTSPTLTQDGNDSIFDGNDVSWTAANPGTIAATHGVLYNDSDSGDPPLMLIDFQGTETRTNGQIFQIIWSTSGIIRFEVT